MPLPYLAGIAGGLFAFFKGSPASGCASLDALVMILIGGMQTIAGPVLGAAVQVLLKDFLLPLTPYWRSCMGIFVIALALGFPQGIVGSFALAFSRMRSRPSGNFALLEVKNLAKAYGGVQAVADVSFALQPQGDPGPDRPDGAGESTCFNMLGGQIRPQRGGASS